MQMLASFRIESTEHVVFLILAVIAIGGALAVVIAQDIVHAALALVVTLTTTAGVYVLLSAEFLSLVQILVYGGGVSILVLFAVMVTRVRESRQRLDGPQMPFAFVAGLAVAILFALMITRTDWTQALPGRLRGETVSEVRRIETTNSSSRGVETLRDTDALGHELFSTFAVPFEVASLVLLIALLGAIILSRSEEDEVA